MSDFETVLLAGTERCFANCMQHHASIRQNTQVCDIVVFVACLAMTMFFAIGNIDAVASLAKEDRLIESLSAIFFFAAAAVCFWFIRNIEYRAIRVLWLILCVVFAGEETSWLQRHLHYSVPSVEKVNYQNEFNFHNLNIFSEDAAGVTAHDTGNDWTRELRGKLTPQNLFNLGFFVYFLVFPILAGLESVREINQLIELPELSPKFLVLVWSCVGLTIVASMDIVPGSERRHYMLELRETYMALFIMLHILSFAPLGHARPKK